MDNKTTNYNIAKERRDILEKELSEQVLYKSIYKNLLEIKGFTGKPETIKTYDYKKKENKEQEFPTSLEGLTIISRTPSHLRTRPFNFEDTLHNEEEYLIDTALKNFEGATRSALIVNSSIGITCHGRSIQSAIKLNEEGEVEVVYGKNIFGDNAELPTGLIDKAKLEETIELMKKLGAKGGFKLIGEKTLLESLEQEGVDPSMLIEDENFPIMFKSFRPEYGAIGAIEPFVEHTWPNGQKMFIKNEAYAKADNGIALLVVDEPSVTLEVPEWYDVENKQIAHISTVYATDAVIGQTFISDMDNWRIAANFARRYVVTKPQNIAVISYDRTSFVKDRESVIKLR